MSNDADDFGFAAMQEQVEKLVDTWGLATICDVLAKVCADKAEHSRVNRNDPTSARHWEAAQLDLDRVARRREERTGERSQV
jgi:hypothetical protein